MKRRKDIIYLHPHFTIPGGAGKFVLETGKILSNKGYKITVISIKSDNKIIGEYKKFINFIDIGGPLSSSIFFWLTFPLSYYKISNFLKNSNNYILFPQVFPANWWGFLYKLFHPEIKLIWMCQEPSAFIHSSAWIQAVDNTFMRIIIRVLNPILSILDKKLAQLSDLVIVNSYYSKRYAKKVYGFGEDKLKVVYLGANLAIFRPNSKRKKKKQILSVSRLTKFKNIDILIKAMKIIKQKGYRYKLVIVGEGEEKQNLERIVKTLGISKHILFKGSVSTERLIKFYQESKLSVTCAVDEPFGLSVVESMSCGTPMIAVNSGGPAELIKDAENGLLVSGRNEYILAETILKLVNNRKLLKEFTNSCLLQSKTFTWDNSIKKLCYFFDQLD